MLMDVRAKDEPILRYGLKKYRKIADAVVKNAAKINIDETAGAIADAKAEKLQELIDEKANTERGFNGRWEILGDLLPVAIAAVDLWIGVVMGNEDEQMELTVDTTATVERRAEGDNLKSRLKGEISMFDSAAERESEMAGRN